MPPPREEPDFFGRLGRLLDLEAEAEREQAAQARRLSPAEAERRGDCLIDLAVRDEEPGLGGRVLITLVPRHRPELPPSRLGVGAPVFLTTADTALRGIVAERGPGLIRVAVEELPDGLPEGAVWQLLRAADEAARRRQQAALDRARHARGDRLAELREVLLGGREPAFGPEPEVAPLNPALNESQRSAVRFALSAADVAVIHGPPGTGKTTAVAELIRQAVRRGAKVLACAPSNLAVDNLLERLVAHGERVVRLGHPARVLPGLREHTLDEMVDEHPDMRQARKAARKAYSLFRQAGKWTRTPPEPGTRQALRQEGRALLADARKLEALAVERVLDEAAVTCATLTGVDAELLGPRRFDLAVLDEACQSTEPACWIPLLRADRVVLAGDHCQLPPTVVSVEAARGGLRVSLMERLVARFGGTITRRLRVQYRMHEAIMRFPADEFYDGDLAADAAVAGHLLRDLADVAPGSLTDRPLLFLDTAGAGYEEEGEPDSESRRNPREAALAARKVRALLAAGVPAGDIAVIAPYAAQVRLLRDLLTVPGLEIDSVDGFQGREKEAVVYSLVRSNPEGDIGFLADIRRTNVALTRARRFLLVVGDSATLSAEPFYARLFAHCETVGAYQSVWEEETV
jgi:superfamily I DNA and/or RNA helicase